MHLFCNIYLCLTKLDSVSKRKIKSETKGSFLLLGRNCTVFENRLCIFIIQREVRLLAASSKTVKTDLAKRSRWTNCDYNWTKNKTSKSNSRRFVCGNSACKSHPRWLLVHDLLPRYLTLLSSVTLINTSSNAVKR